MFQKSCGSEAAVPQLGAGVKIPLLAVLPAGQGITAGALRRGKRGNGQGAALLAGEGYGDYAVLAGLAQGGGILPGGKGSILGTVLASLIICILRYGLPLCFDVSTQNLDLPIGIVLVLVVLGREIAGRGMIAKAVRTLRKSAAAS